ncbi:MAG: hypothetical protein FWE16_02750 [Firmicutes bacterium]|nr:hypothetical protein [Bacillota bacterium]
MFCSKCGNNCGEGTNYCARCGSNIVPSAIVAPQLVRRGKGRIVVGIILYAFSALALFGAIGFQSIWEPVTEYNTSGYTGTIRQISPVGQFRIYTHEQDFPLFIVVPDFVINEQALQELAVGDVINFRIRNLGANNTMNGVSIHVVCLSINGIEIITLESANEHFDDVRRMAGVGFGILSGVLFFIGTCLIVWYCVQTRKRKAYVESKEEL